MNFGLNVEFLPQKQSDRQAVILACYSKRYFSPYLRLTGAVQLIWTTGLMAPEAYTLHAALSAWINLKSPVEITKAAAKAYCKYQRCSLKTANNLIISAW